MEKYRIVELMVIAMSEIEAAALVEQIDTAIDMWMMCQLVR